MSSLSSAFGERPVWPTNRLRALGRCPRERSTRTALIERVVREDTACSICSYSVCSSIRHLGHRVHMSTNRPFVALTATSRQIRRALAPWLWRGAQLRARAVSTACSSSRATARTRAGQSARPYAGRHGRRAPLRPSSCSAAGTSPGGWPTSSARG
ncbi:hypothetical protein D3C87_997510 [compost metagenome]